MPYSELFTTAIARIDAANAADPNREMFQSREQPKELLYSQRMTGWLNRLSPDASEALRLAARGQHICRWTIPRNHYPLDRAGYHRWRSACQRMHAEKLGEILHAVGYDESTIGRVQSLVRKERLKLDPEAQLLEDVVCLVFLENYFAEFSRQHDEAKLIDIVRKTWKKMSARGHQAALQLPLSDEIKSIVEKALNQPHS
ncbi:MAG TPA: DUF4202 domain-containing protein [Pirellulales bacterium]|nr:DUF4202 domain-containing protein [Pirellulales bacterium]